MRKRGGAADLLAEVWRAGSMGMTEFARVAQLDRASASEAEGCEFNPRRAHQSSFRGFFKRLNGINGFCVIRFSIGLGMVV